MNMQGNLGRNIPQAAPQGIAALQGMSPSPRAGIGNVQDRVDAFRQNPQALQTPPNVPPDLLDALALQKIMSQKEAAKREMAMAAPGQQPTVVQQLEQKALGNTKQEIAQQVSGVAQKQAQDKQQAMQKLMAGIARVPGAGDGFARMASGGIVAFQNRGEVPPVVDPREVQRILRKSPMARTPEENEILRQSGIKLEQRRMGPEGIVQRAERGLQQIGPAARQYLTEGAAGLSPEELEQRSDTGAITEKLYRMLGGQQVKPPSPGMSEADLQDLMPTRQSLPQTPLPPEMGVGQPSQAPAMRMPPAQVRSKVPAGVAGAVQQPVVRPDSTGQGISPPAPQQAAPSFTQDLMAGLSKYQGQEFENMSKLAKELYALPPEVRQIYEQRIAQARQAAQPAPQDFAGRFAELGRYGPAKGIAGAYGQMMEAQRAQQKQRQSDLTAAENQLLQAQETARLKAAETALGARGKAGETFGQIAGVGERARATDVSADVARLDRESQERRLDRQIAAQRELKKLEMDNPEWKSKLEYAMRNPQAAALMFPKGDRAALDYLKLHVDLKQSEMQALANDLSPGAAERKKVLAAEVATLSKALGELSGVPLSQPRPSTPAVGTVMQGYRFKGGDPSDRKNWEKV